MKNIETVEKWEVAAAYFREHGYRLHQMQYSWRDPEGYHAWFYVGDKTVEIVTYNEQVQRLIPKYNTKSPG